MYIYVDINWVELLFIPFHDVVVPIVLFLLS